MGTIICHKCESTISYFKDEKVTRLYSKGQCEQCQKEATKK